MDKVYQNKITIKETYQEVSGTFVATHDVSYVTEATIFKNTAVFVCPRNKQLVSIAVENDQHVWEVVASIHHTSSVQLATLLNYFNIYTLGVEVKRSVPERPESQIYSSHGIYYEE